jgi:hypothetical protein
MRQLQQPRPTPFADAALETRPEAVGQSDYVHLSDRRRADGCSMWPRCSGARTKDSTGYEVGTFNDDTRPTSAQVLTLIDQAVADVQAGYAAVTPSWPDDPETIDEARAHTEVFAGKTLGQVADHVAEVVGALTTKPVVMGHSTGGLLAQMIADRGLSAATWSSTRGPSGASCRSRSRRRAPRLRC